MTKRASITPWVRKQLEDLVNVRGLTMEQAGYVFGLTRIQVNNCFTHHGLFRTRVPRITPAEARAIVADYKSGMSISATAAKARRSKPTVRRILRDAGIDLKQRYARDPRRRTDGTFRAGRKHTEAEIDALIAQATSLRIPEPLWIEWRKWSIPRRAQFIRRLRAALGDPGNRPQGPFSANVQPFEYGTPAAHKIADRLNKGRPSRNFIIKIDITSQGVIFEGALWFWTSPAGGYYKGPYSKLTGRPALHRYIYERLHGPIPKGHVIRFRDGNKNNLDPSNLTTATRNEVIRENQAAALTRDSRERLSILLNRQTNKTSHDLIHSLTD